MKRYYLILVILLFVSIFVQAQDNVIPENCTTLAGNEACYGYGEIELFVNCEIMPDFDEPGDVIDIDPVCRMKLSEDSAALFMVQPEGYNEQFFMALTADVEIQNAASSVFELAAVTLEETTVYSGPGSDYAVIETLAVDTIVRANACNCTRNWLRIIMENNQVGWVPARRMEVNETSSTLPIIKNDTPLYSDMQAFTLITGTTSDDMSAGGLLIQMMGDMIPLQINGVTIELDSTAYIESSTQVMIIDILEGNGQITFNQSSLNAPAGTQISIPLLEEGKAIQPTLYSAEHVAHIPLELLPGSINPIAALQSENPTIIGAEQCSVVSNTGTNACPVYFVNPDGDDIVQMNIEFVYAAQGEWTGSIHEDLTLLEGDMAAGTLAWDVSCSLGSENFIGPIEWLITLIDETGHTSEPFEASFNCVAG